MIQDATLDDLVTTEINGWLGKKRMSRAELARQLDVTWKWLDRRLSGEVELTLNETEQIAQVLEVSLWDLLRPKHEEMDRRHGPVMDAMLAGAGKTSKSRGSHPGQMEL